MQALNASFSFVGIPEFPDLLDRRGYRLLQEELRPLSTGKRLWFGVFAGPE
jgi:hypothetical protein